MLTTFTAPTISCGGCARNVKAALSRTPGVNSVEVDVPSKSVAVEFSPDETSPERLAAALSEAGYPPETRPARG